MSSIAVSRDLPCSPRKRHFVPHIAGHDPLVRISNETQFCPLLKVNVASNLRKAHALGWLRSQGFKTFKIMLGPQEHRAAYPGRCSALLFSTPTKARDNFGTFEKWELAASQGFGRGFDSAYQRLNFKNIEDRIFAVIEWNYAA
jgi:hypothetical protein